MGIINPRQPNISYEFVPPDPAGKDTGQELERGFDVLFDIVLKEAQVDALRSQKTDRKEGHSRPGNPYLTTTHSSV